MDSPEDVPSPTGADPSSRPRVVLHIGAMKTGTTYLQGLLWANRAPLVEAGVLFPGDAWSDQVLAVKDVLGPAPDPVVRARSEGAWPRMVETLAAHPGTSVLSMEFLSFCDPDQARHVVGSLTDAGVGIDVVLTVRDAASTVPAHWQTTCVNRKRMSWPQYAHGVLHDGDGMTKVGRQAFRNMIAVPRMIETWCEVAGADRLTVVTTPRSSADPTLLWRRFASVVGVDPDLATEPPAYANPSLGQASAELLRRVNGGVTDLTHDDYQRLVKRLLGEQVLPERRRLEAKATINTPLARYAVRRNRLVRAVTERTGVRVVGDLVADLPGDLAAAGLEGLPDDPPTDPPDAEVLAAAADAAEGLRQHLAEHVATLGDADAAAAAADPHAWATAPDPVEAAVTDITALVLAAAGHRPSRPDTAPAGP